MKASLTRAWMFAVLFAICSFASAREVSVDKAATYAQKFWNSPKSRANQSALNLVWDSHSIQDGSRSNSEPLYYVFAPKAGNGFVIISGDDQINPVLAYSFESNISEVNYLPDGFRWWLEFISSQIEYVRDNNIVNQEHYRQWSRNDNPGTPVVELETVKWGQSDPFNADCPIMNGQRCVTGCTQTATAIVMRYHQWPEYGVGQTAEYHGIINGNDITFPSRNLEHKYDWGKMPLTKNAKNWNEEERKEVSVLMADIGAAFEAYYNVHVTSARLKPKSLFNHFNYSPDMVHLGRESYDDKEWIDMLKKEISIGNPILYDGFEYNGAGHQFVLDGYDSNDYFRVNWGWEGSYDGYFSLNQLGGVGGYKPFNYSQTALINMTPNKENKTEPDTWLATEIIKVETENYIGEADEEISDGLFLNNDNTFGYRIYYRIGNISPVGFNGRTHVCITDINGNIKETLHSDQESWLPEVLHVLTSCRFDLTNPIEKGDRIRIFYNSETNDELKQMNQLNQFSKWEVILADDKTIAETTAFQFDRIKRIITLDVKENVKVKLESNGKDLSEFVNQNDNRINIDCRKLQECGDGSEYTIRLEKGIDVKEIKFSLKKI